MSSSHKHEMREAIRKMLMEGFSGTQEHLCERLAGMGFDVNQSTVSRALRKLGAIKSMESDGVVYRLPNGMSHEGYSGSVGNLIRSVRHNESMIVIRTVVGSASFIGEFLDHAKAGGILGTIAGDDTLFVAPENISDIAAMTEKLTKILLSGTTESS